MPEKRERKPVFISPKGVAKFIQVMAPSTKFKAEGEYQVRMLLDPTDPANIEFKAKIEKAHAEAVAAAKKANPKQAKSMMVHPIPIKDDEDKDGQPTGKGWLVSFKAKASGTYADKRKDEAGNPAVWRFRPNVEDATGKPLPQGTLVYGGSVVKVAYEIKHTLMPTGAFYTSLPMKSVRVLSLAASQHRSYFGAAEEGYEGEESDVTTGQEDAVDNSGAESGADF